MISELNIEERKPIWIALSNFYLDTELQECTFIAIAKKIKESPYSFEEVKQIDKEEVFPILFTNSLSVAGVWTGFQEEWLLRKITKKLHKRNLFARVFNRLTYFCFGRMNKDYWKKLKEELLQ